MKRILFSLIFIALTSSAVPARELSLDDAIQIAQDSSVAAYASKNALIKSQWEYKAFLAGRKPQLSFQLNSGYQKFITDPTLRNYKLRNYNVMDNFGEFILEKEVTGLGGKFYVNTAMLWTEYFGPNRADRIFSSIPIGLGYSNDLLGYNPYKWEKEIEDYHMESERKAHDYELSTIEAEAEKYFIACIVASSRYELYKFNLEVTNAALEIGKAKFSIASITKNELFALELQAINAENSVYDARKEVEMTRRDLFSYLRIEDDGQELEIPEAPDYIDLNFDELLRLAKLNNPSYRSSNEEIIKAKQRLEKTKIEYSFLKTGLELNFGLQNCSGNFGSSYMDQRTYAVGGMTFRIPIFDGGLSKSRVKAAEYNLEYKLSLEEEELRRLTLEVSQAIKEFNVQQDLLKRTCSAIVLADESFSLAQELYENGNIDINTFILALNRKDEAYSNYLSSLKSYWDSRYTLRRICVIRD